MVGKKRTLLPDRTNSDPHVKLGKYSPSSTRIRISMGQRWTSKQAYHSRGYNCRRMPDKVAVVNLGYRCDSIDYQWDLICRKDNERKAALVESASISSGKRESRGCPIGDDESFSTAKVDSSDFHKWKCYAVLGLEVLTHAQFRSLATGKSLSLARNNSKGREYLLPSVFICSGESGEKKRTVFVRRDYGKATTRNICSCWMTARRRRVSNESRKLQLPLVDLIKEDEDPEHEEGHSNWDSKQEGIENISEENASNYSDTQTVSIGLISPEIEVVSSNDGRDHEREETAPGSPDTCGISVDDDRKRGGIPEKTFAESARRESASCTDLPDGKEEQGGELTQSKSEESRYCNELPKIEPVAWLRRRRGIGKRVNRINRSRIIGRGLPLTAGGVQQGASDSKRSAWNDFKPSTQLSPSYTRADYLWDSWRRSSSLLEDDVNGPGIESCANVSKEAHPKGLRRSSRRGRFVDRLNYGREYPKRSMSEHRRRGWKRKIISRDGDVHLTKCTACNAIGESYKCRNYGSANAKRTRQRRKRPSKKNSSRRSEGYASEYASCTEDSADETLVSSSYIYGGYVSCNEDTSSDSVFVRGEESLGQDAPSKGSTQTEGCVTTDIEETFAENGSPSERLGGNILQEGNDNVTEGGFRVEGQSDELELCWEISEATDDPLESEIDTQEKSIMNKPLRRCRANSWVIYSEDSDDSNIE